MEIPSEKLGKLGIRIEKPISAKMNPIFPLLLCISFALIGLTAWLLVLENLGEPPPAWLRKLLETFGLMM